MALQPGSRLGGYEIVSSLGAGGMGEVYRARDTKLGREVAIKLLLEEVSADPERLARFEREARVLASLNHPNIATLYGFESDGDTGFLVMELVEGETLADRIARGPMPVGEAVAVFVEIARALEAAHASGVIHRDLKPANIKTGAEGRVKVLDFGLAKPVGERAGDEAALSRSPTLTLAATQRGEILGTVAYMSPEQARGRPVDRRTDIWAFGACLLEALSGERAFAAEDAAGTLAKVLETEPRLQSLPAETPERLRSLLRRCLRKDPSRRWHDIADVRLELEECLEGGPPSSVAQMPSAGRGARAWVGALAALVSGLVIGFLLSRREVAPQRSSDRAPIRAEIPLPEEAPFEIETERPALALSSDGRLLAYVANEGGVRRLYLRDLGRPEAVPLSGTAGAYGPFFSPDGASISFFSDRELKTLSVGGGRPRKLAILSPVTRGASWLPDGRLIYTTDTNGPLTLLPVHDVEGVEGELLTTPEYSHRWPEVLPGGNHVLFTDDTGGDFSEARICVLSLDTREIRTLVEGGTNPRYAPSGHIVFARSGQLLAVPFDAQSLEVRGKPVVVVDDVMMEPSGAAHFSISSTGTLAYVTGGVFEPRHELVWVDRQGAIVETPIPAGAYMNPRLSPDGGRVALTVREGSNYDIYLGVVDRGGLSRLTFDPGEDFCPAWTADGRRVAFGSEIAGRGPQLAWAPADGSGEPEVLLSTERWSFPLSFSPDDRHLAFQQASVGLSMDVSIADLGQGTFEQLLHSSYDEWQPAFSPDGRWLAYVSNESGRPQVYATRYPGPPSKVLVSTGEGTEPVWSPLGDELFYRDGDSMYVVSVDAGDELRVGSPELLFEAPMLHSWRIDAPQNYDVSRDGRRFLMVRNAAGARPTRIHLIVDWLEELSRVVEARE